MLALARLLFHGCGRRRPDENPNIGQIYTNCAARGNFAAHKNTPQLANAPRIH